ncbi:hypothetical protein ISN45_Aa01g005430 [Arabidopsis thaliana x Arabidopsis arenosa]|uniref:Uncharacterized protein n=1 Tax=Arabidopsis thaliana x Arabidopsis arenosa TaxID=1240361 RepID=A0A8T2BUZ5_9BRAS|nr:hypothetical protein ISN45_Aa01g005390 [Arabidopsis thaliana x Arabidopsis arenosa]KAG7591518.1 hypothetical protein ISN45_Aa01g005430 [Arabidopsis thaliana x Arabidopsis arenosa]
MRAIHTQLSSWFGCDSLNPLVVTEDFEKIEICVVSDCSPEYSLYGFLQFLCWLDEILNSVFKVKTFTLL